MSKAAEHVSTNLYAGFIPHLCLRATISDIEAPTNFAMALSENPSFLIS